MGAEIERKFLVRSLPELSQFPHDDISQGYVAASDDLEVRLRQKGGKFFETIKQGSGLTRVERECELAREQFEAFWPATEGRRLEKTRYEIPHANHTIELDVYRSSLEGLVVAEVEFASEEAARSFVPPDWFGKEVTDDPRYKNLSLALHGRPVPVYDLESGVAELVEQIKNNLGDDPVIVLVAGGSASGKTNSVAKRLKETFQDDAVIISMDDYYRGRKFMDAEAARGVVLNWDMPQAIDLELLKSHIQLLKAGTAVPKPIYSFKTGEREGYEAVHPRRVIILEGLFTLDDILADEGDVRAFVDIGLHGRILRRLLRDITRTGQKPVDILHYFAEIVEPMHQAYVESTKKNADFIISNEYCPEKEAHRTGMYEVQLKFRAGITKEDLRKLGAEKLASVYQTDHYYNPKDRNLRDTDEMIRIREEAGKSILTYKGPRMDSEFRKRPKFEFELSEGAMRKFMLVYGSRFKTIEKVRTLYQLDGVIIALDSVAKNENHERRALGEFLEVRSTDGNEAKIQSVLSKLGLDMSQKIVQSYVEM